MPPASEMAVFAVSGRAAFAEILFGTGHEARRPVIGSMASITQLIGLLRPLRRFPVPMLLTPLDTDTAKDPQSELYPVLKRIKAILDKNTHDFMVLCLGPELPVEDDDVHPWTAVIDPYLAKGDRLMAIAAGNGGSEMRNRD